LSSTFSCLQEAGIIEQQSGDCAEYLTDIETSEVGYFGGKLLVTMCPIAVKLVTKMANQMHQVHLPPVHIGDSRCIGIADLLSPHRGCLTPVLKDGDIPVFWPSSQTALLAIRSARPALAYFGHCIRSSTMPTINRNRNVAIHLTELHKERQLLQFSVLSLPMHHRISRLENCLIAGSWRKGVKELQSFTQGSLLQAAASLSHSKCIAVTTGFPCNTSLSCPDETDGPSGILAIVRSLIACNKQVTIVLDQKNLFLRKLIEEALRVYVPKSNDVAVVPYPPDGVGIADMTTAKEFLFNQSTGCIKFDHLVALERSGPNYEGRNMTMTARDISSMCDPIDQLFMLADELNIKTIAVGDGGNEIGFGKLQKEVAEFVDHGQEIACVVPVDHLIVSGVSNWGGYAIAAALYCIRSCPVHVHYVKRGICKEQKPMQEDQLELFMPSVDEERKLLSFLMDAGLRDGVLPDQMMSVDGRTFDDCHAAKIKEIREIASTE
jgi:hypothetical protein